MNLDDRHECVRCGHNAKPKSVLTPDGKHFAKAVCAACNAYFAWIGKPDSQKYKRPASHKNLVKKFSPGYCQLCLTPEWRLPNGESLEGHHVVEFQDGGEPTRLNTWILCTACHSLVNWRRTYIGHILLSLTERKNAD